MAASITLGSGQFCTNPGLLFLIDAGGTEKFISELSAAIVKVEPAIMLNKSVCQNYYRNKEFVQQQPGVKILAVVESAGNDIKGAAVLLETTGRDFIKNENLQTEVFGPASLIVKCKDEAELLEAINSLHGQLTGTVAGTKEDIDAFATSIEALSGKVGRLLYNGVPTGVEVCHAMVHGGPYPATTNANNTSVGADAIKRFARPVSLQDCPPAHLPVELRNSNERNIMRKVNGVYTREAI